MTSWKNDYPGDPEMYIAFFNYHLQNSKKEVVQLDTRPSRDKNLTILDSANQPAGYLYSKIHYDSSEFAKAQRYLMVGIEKNPKRLDMYFGRIYSLREAGFYEKHKNEILNLIAIHSKEPTDWLWSLNEPVKNPVAFFKDAIQDYNYALFNLEQPRFNEIEEISKAMLEIYPGDLKNYSNIGASSLIRKDFDSALEYFLKALEFDNDDALVLSNIAWTYKLKGDKSSAIKYYKKVIEVGSEDQINFANHQISELSKK